MTDQCETYIHDDYRMPHTNGVVVQGCAHNESIEPNETVKPAAELPDWLQAIDPDPTHHHFVEVVQEPALGHGSQIVNLVAVCTCGWRFGERQIYLGASTTWAKERARHQLENAGIEHLRSLTRHPHDCHAADH